MKSLICKIFGHIPTYGWGRNVGGGYFRIRRIETDGIGTKHATLICNCERCDKEYRVGMLQLPKENKNSSL